MKMWTNRWVWSALVAVSVSGCASSRSGLPDDAESAQAPKPTLSVAMTRNVPARDVELPADAVVDPAEAVSATVSAETGISFYRIQVGDPIVIHLRGIYPRDEQVEDVVDENGRVTIPLVGDIAAAGRSTSQLEEDMTRMYIDGGYYRSITVNVVIPSRTYFIRGEVRQPGKFPIASGITLMQAIAAAGGYTEFASQRGIKLIRGGSTTKVNMRDIENNPERDIRLESGDVIVVDRSIL